MGGIAFAVGGTNEHVHVCLMIPPHIAVATFIGRLKGASAHWVNHIARPNANFGWQKDMVFLPLAKVL
jgi:REP element-mobilizing transposase RayT